MPDDVQGTEPQGGEAGTFESYLQSVPEDAREYVAPYLKEAEKNVNGRLQEAAEFKSAWEPYQQVEALSAYPPEQLSELLAWHQQVTSSDEAFRTWLEQTAGEAGITPQEQAQLEQAEEQGELSREEVQQLVQQAAEERIAPIQEQFQNLQAEKAIDTEESSINGAFEEICAQNDLQLSKDQRAMILDLGMPLAVDARGQELPMGDASWVAKGFERWREIATEGQRTFVNEAAKAPKTALSGGGLQAFKPTTDWGEASAQARERLRQAQSS